MTALFWILTVVTESEERSSAAIVPSVISEEVIVLAVAKDPNPRLVLAVAAEVAPVPPFAMATLPVTLVALVAFVAVVADVALPLKLAVIVPAEKFPLPSLETIAFGVLESVAVVALLLTFPAVVMVERFESEIDPASLSFVTEPFARSLVAIEPSTILEESTESEAKSEELIVPSKMSLDVIEFIYDVRAIYRTC